MGRCAAILVDRTPLGVAVDGRGGREHQPSHPVPQHGFEQRQGAGGVVAEIALRDLHRLAGLDQGGEVHDRVDRVGGEQRVQGGTIADIADDQFGAGGHGLAMATAQIVEDGDAMAGFDQLQRHGAADISGAPDHENVHV